MSTHHLPSRQFCPEPVSTWRVPAGLGFGTGLLGVTDALLPLGVVPEPFLARLARLALFGEVGVLLSVSSWFRMRDISISIRNARRDGQGSEDAR